MQRLWAPWRKKYIAQKKITGCIFCRKPRSQRDLRTLVLDRGETVFSILNLYPYNNGHVLIAPYRHLRDLTGLNARESQEILSLAKKTIKKLDKILEPHGYNVGFNIGKAGGAGYDKHLHMHIVPRWNGDTNFMPVVSQSKVISESLSELRKRFLAA